MIAILLTLTLFTPGEKLEYAARFSFLTIGTMILEVKDTLTYEGYSCYHINSILNSNPSLGWLFSLHDTIDVYTRVDSLLPLYYEEKLHENKYNSHTILRFYHDSSYVLCNDTQRIAFKKNTRDLLSFWYHLRTVSLVVGESIPLKVHASMENHDINCWVDREEVVTTPLGDFETVKVEPQTAGKGIFGSGGGMQIWYSLDEKRYPVLIKAKMKSGSILFKLKEVSD